MSGIGEASGTITLGDAIIKLVYFVQALKQASRQLERYVVTLDLIESLAPASRDGDQFGSVSVFFNGDKHRLISSCRTNARAILADAEHLIEICKRAESEGLQETILKLVRQAIKNSANTARWVFNEGYMKDLFAAATQLKSPLFMAYSSLTLARNNIRGADVHSKLKALTDTMTQHILSFAESQKKYHRSGIDVVQRVIPVKLPGLEVKRQLSFHGRGSKTHSIGGLQAGSSTTSLEAAESTKGVSTCSSFEASEPGNKVVHTIAGERATRLTEEENGKTPIETHCGHPDNLDHLGTAKEIAGIPCLPEAHTSIAGTEGAVGSDEQAPSTPCDSESHRKPSNHENLSGTHSLLTDLLRATDGNSNHNADAQSTLSMNERMGDTAIISADDMIRFRVKTITMHHDGYLVLILK
ncbi:hypothetical protein BJY04DRAFT_214132 [Aspergillus karnatakaensis]|uniref:uncharacterized protein n=1 Tax=Aspergillus karnatakaensis TaxID=1810916 RepID=UPI003CCD410C